MTTLIDAYFDSYRDVIHDYINENGLDKWAELSARKKGK